MIKVALFVLLAVLTTVLLIGFISMMACIRLSGKINQELEEREYEDG